jgi:hypothetical protein
MDSRANRNNLKMMSEDLRDIQGIMTKNIQEVLGRGEKLESEVFFNGFVCLSVCLSVCLFDLRSSDRTSKRCSAGERN